MKLCSRLLTGVARAQNEHDSPSHMIYLPESKIQQTQNKATFSGTSVFNCDKSKIHHTKAIQDLRTPSLASRGIGQSEWGLGKKKFQVHA